MSSKALFIVEGEDREKEFFLQIQRAFHLDMEIVPFCGNISMLYEAMEATDFMSDVKTLLLSKTTDPVKRMLLQDTYSDVFMIFDLDPQHGIKILEGESEEEALRRNARSVFKKALIMARRLNNSTDPTLGQLYINYPSIESFRDADDFFDSNYANKLVALRDLCKVLGGKGYKEISARGKLARKRVSSFTADEFSQLALMNAFKLKRVIDGIWQFMSYDDFRIKSEQCVIAQKQCEGVVEDLNLWVLNTSLFFLFDYKGREYYEWVMREVGIENP